MYTKCTRLPKISFNSIANIEKWIHKSCNCHECQAADVNLEEYISNVTITRHPKLTHQTLLLTSKMIIKIQLEITKQVLLQSTEV